MKQNPINVSELNEDRYEIINNLVNIELVKKFINDVEALEIDLMKSNIQAKEIYQYLLTIIVNQC
jgi:hypothetical protein